MKIDQFLEESGGSFAAFNDALQQHYDPMVKHAAAVKKSLKDMRAAAKQAGVQHEEAVDRAIEAASALVAALDDLG